jgi:hypothetical protein
VRAAIFSYNPSDYYVDLVRAFALGYRTGTFVIPSPQVAPGAGDGVAPVQQDDTQAATPKGHGKAAEATKAAKAKSAKKAAKAKKAKKAKKAATAKAAKAHEAAKAHKAHVADAARAAKARKAANAARRHHAGRAPTPPRPVRPRTTTSAVTGALTAGPAGSWAVGGTTFTSAQAAASIRVTDLDDDGSVGPLAAELAGVVRRSGRVRVELSRTGSTVAVTRIVVLALPQPLPGPTPTPAGSPTAAPTRRGLGPATPTAIP